MKRIFRALAAIAGWVGLGLFFHQTVLLKSGDALIHELINYFSYFTILSNIMVAVGFTLSCAGSRSRIGTFLDRPEVRAGVGIYIAVTGVVFLVLLSHLSASHGPKYVANVLLHYVVPIMYAVDWLVFVPKGRLRWMQVTLWLIFPLLYAVYTLVRGALGGFYPYFFLNVTRLGYLAVLGNCALLLCGFVALGLLLTAIDGWMRMKKEGALHSARQ